MEWQSGWARQGQKLQKLPRKPGGCHCKGEDRTVSAVGCVVSIRSRIQRAVGRLVKGEHIRHFAHRKTRNGDIREGLHEPTLQYMQTSTRRWLRSCGTHLVLSWRFCDG